MVTLNKFHKDKFFTKIQHASSASGVIGLPEYEVFGENTLRVVTDFTSSGILTLEARIKHSETWENLGTLLADGDSEEFDIGSYDYIRFNFTTPSGSSGQVGVSGFFKGSASSASGAGFNLIQPDAGTAPVSDSTNSILNITSSDGSILVGGDSVTDTINLTVSSSLIDKKINEYDQDPSLPEGVPWIRKANSLSHTLLQIGLTITTSTYSLKVKNKNNETLKVDFQKEI